MDIELKYGLNVVIDHLEGLNEVFKANVGKNGNNEVVITTFIIESLNQILNANLAIQEPQQVEPDVHRESLNDKK